MFRTYIENRITLQGNTYKCHLCNFVVSHKDDELLQMHICDLLHQTRLSQISEQVRQHQSELLSTVSDTKYKRIVKNQIALENEPHAFRCHVCKCPIIGISNIWEHIKGSRHRDSFISNNGQKVEQKDFLRETPETAAIPSSHHELSGEVPDCIIRTPKKNTYGCQLCQCMVGSSQNVLRHVQGNTHKKNEGSVQLQKNEQKEAYRDLANDTNIRKRSNSLVRNFPYCRLCSDVLRTPSMLQCHVLQHLHSELDFKLEPDIVTFTQDVSSKFTIQCSLCQVNFSNHADTENHLQSDKHVKRLAFFTYLKSNGETSNLLNSSIEDAISNGFKFEPSQHITYTPFCNICEVPVPFKVGEHVKGKRHNKKLASALATSTDLNKKEPFFDLSHIYPCFMCTTKFSDIEELLNHYNSFKHRCKMTNFHTILDDPFVNFKEVNETTVLSCSLCHASQLSFLKTAVAVQHILSEKHENNKKLVHSSQPIKLTENIHAVNCGARGKPEYVPIESQEKDTKHAKIVPKGRPNQELNNSLYIKSIEKLTLLNSRSRRTKSIPDSFPKSSKSSEFQSNHDELVALGFSKNSASIGFEPSKAESTNMNDILDGLVNLNFSKSEQKKLPILTKQKRVRVPDPTLRKISFAQNVENFGQSFIDCCILPGEKYIYKSSSKKVTKISSTIGLTFPYTASVRCCLACVCEFPADRQSLFEHVQQSGHLKGLKKMETDDKAFEDYPDQFSDLHLAKLYMQEESDDWIHCYACNTKVGNQNIDIQLHSESMDHIRKSQNWSMEANILSKKFSDTFKDVWFYAQYFSCEVCKKKFDFEIEFVSHLEKKSHIESLRKMEQKKISVEFDLCPFCSLFWFGQSGFYDRHCNDQFHKCCMKNGNFLVREMQHGAIEFLLNFEILANNLVHESDRVDSEIDKELEILHIIEETVKYQYPKAKAHAFGSRISHLANLDTDLDIFLDCEDVYMNNTTQKKGQQYLTSVQKLFENDINTWITDEILLSTRVPIMKLRHIPTNIKCDISFMNGLSVEKSKLLRCYSEAYPICRKLILYLKKWLTFCHLSGSDCITTFAISWFVIFYLQMKNLVPSVNYLIENGIESRIVDGWECGYLTDLPKDHSTDLTFKDCLQGFFTYYANFDYQKLVVCPLIGEAVPKRRFAYSEQLPEEMRFYEFRLANDKSIIFRIDSPLCLQDPLDLSQNITKAVKKYHLRCFRQYCQESQTILSSL
ncbi:hypothetical protein QAD02_022489 [Eretmocerus hayati]|uniref:Uncharacterized protein n=1 Tax=Eretmocerus hayati TaxID=131215 RepID=A0ACC2PSX9_9HYME|nr:hypothetical protein QAD02_022489 [Eretmocerus hayati]